MNTKHPNQMTGRISAVSTAAGGHGCPPKAMLRAKVIRGVEADGEPYPSATAKYQWVATFRWETTDDDK